MKFAASLLYLTIFASLFVSCTTDVNRRDLFSPTKGHGYWTDRLHKRAKHEGIFGISNSRPRQ